MPTYTYAYVGTTRVLISSIELNKPEVLVQLLDCLFVKGSGSGAVPPSTEGV